MVDTDPGSPPDPLRALVEQKKSGIWESNFDFAAAAIPGFVIPTRSRVYHRFRIGGYAPGRHQSYLPGLGRCAPETAAIWWYGFSPWTEEVKRRKRQFAQTFGDFDKRFRVGIQHYYELDKLDDHWRRIVPYSRPLADTIPNDPPRLIRRAQGLARRIGGVGRRFGRRFFPQ